jgi:hypothetical protein
MNLSAPFVARPVATTLLTIGIALLGLLAFPYLPVAPSPLYPGPPRYLAESERVGIAGRVYFRRWDLPPRDNRGCQYIRC